MKCNITFWFNVNIIAVRVYSFVHIVFLQKLLVLLMLQYVQLVICLCGLLVLIVVFARVLVQMGDMGLKRD